ncbi:fuconate dehydratase, partial [Streptomyces sp. 4F]
AGGVGLCELVRHLSMFDFVALSGTTEDRMIEYVDHLHEHFEDPVVMANGHYTAPTAPGFSSRMHAASIAAYRYPDGDFWAADRAAAEQEKG